jgi:hypothetical protein
MRTTTRIDDDILDELRIRAQKERTALTKIVNRVLRTGLAAGRSPARRRPPHTETTFSMGRPLVDLRKALVLASRLEDDEVLRKQSLRK